MRPQQPPEGRPLRYYVSGSRVIAITLLADVCQEKVDGRKQLDGQTLGRDSERAHVGGYSARRVRHVKYTHSLIRCGSKLRTALILQGTSEQVKQGIFRVGKI